MSFIHCDKQNNGNLKDVHILIHETCEYVTLSGIRNFTNMIKLKILKWILDNLSGPNVLRVFKREAEGYESERDWKMLHFWL